MGFLLVAQAVEVSGQFAWITLLVVAMMVEMSFGRRRSRSAADGTLPPGNCDPPSEQSSSQHCTHELKYTQCLADVSVLMQALCDMSRCAANECDMVPFFGEVCRTLTENGCYKAVWIARIDEHGNFHDLFHHGPGVNPGQLQEAFHRPRWNVTDPLPSCADDDYEIRLLKHDEKVYGLFGVDLSGRPMEAVQRSLLSQVTEHVTSCLHGIEMQQKCRQVEQALVSENWHLQQQVRQLGQTGKIAVQQERLSALVRMTKRLAHDFNNALTPVILFTDLLMSDSYYWSDSAKSRHYLESANTAAREAANAVRFLQGFYREKLDVALTAPMDLNSAVLEAMSSALEPCDATMGLSVEEELKPLPTITGVVSELSSAFHAIIRNAVEAMPQGGSLRIASRHDCSSVMVEISDTGIGMSEDVRQRCLEPYFTTKSAASKGMGLATAYGAVARHGGAIEIESGAGSGTTVRIRLPKSGTEPPSDCSCP